LSQKNLLKQENNFDKTKGAKLPNNFKYF